MSELTREQFKSLLLDVADEAILKDYPLMVSSLLAHDQALRDRLKEALCKLNALEAHGVDNWEGYSDAMAAFYAARQEANHETA